MYSAEMIQAGVRDLRDLSGEWAELTKLSHDRTPYGMPYWFTAFAETIAVSATLRLVVIRDGRRLKGILPLKYSSKLLGKIPANAISSLTNVHSCRFDLVTTHLDAASVAQATWSVLKRDRSWSAVEIQNVPAGGKFERVMEHAKRDGYLVSKWPTLRSPFLRLPNPSEEPFKNSPAQYKGDRRRIEKRFARLTEFGEPKFEVNTHFNADWFDQFIAIERSGWKGKAGGAIGCKPELVEFYRRVARAAADLGHLRMCALRVGDNTVAMELAFVIDGRCYSPKIAYDERYSSASPGQQLARLTITDLVRQGCSLYDLLGPNARHKALWAGETMAHNNCYIFRPSPLGRFYHYVIGDLAPRLRQMRRQRRGDPQDVS